MMGFDLPGVDVQIASATPVAAATVSTPTPSLYKNRGTRLRYSW